MAGPFENPYGTLEHGMILREHTEKLDADCGLEYSYTICQFTGNYNRLYSGPGCTWGENRESITNTFNAGFLECCMESGRRYESGYTYCEMGEITGVLWPRPTGITISNVSNQIDCSCSSECPTGSWCYSVIATLDWPATGTIDSGSCDPYDPNAQCTPDMDIYLKIGAGCESNSEQTVYFGNTIAGGANMLSGSWTAELNQDSHPGCALYPSGAEIIAATGFDENRTFYAWYNQYSNCAEEASGISSQVDIENCGPSSFEVGVSDYPYEEEVTFIVPSGGDISISSIAYAGFANFNQESFSSGTRFDIRKIHPELNGECPNEENVKYKAIYDFNEGLLGGVIPLSGVTSSKFAAYAETTGNLELGSYVIEKCACPCDTGEAGYLCESGTICCEGSPENKASVSVTFGATSTGVTVDIPYAFYGTGIYTGQCVAYIENQKSAECYSVTQYGDHTDLCELGCNSFSVPQSTIAYGGTAQVHFSGMRSEAGYLCTTANQRGIATTCCPLLIDPDTCCPTGALALGGPEVPIEKRGYTGCPPECTLSGSYPGGIGYSPSGNYLTILDMKAGECVTPIYEGFATGCLLGQKPDADGAPQYVLSFPDDRTMSITKTGENVCEESGDYGKIIGNIYRVCVNSSTAASVHYTGFDSEPPINYDGLMDI